MCLAIPGKVLEVRGKEALVDFGGVRREVRVDLVDAKVGDYVIVHTGCAIQTMSEEDALESLKMLEEILNAE
jgi:hydrogenase expression/formation protein HypC